MQFLSRVNGCGFKPMRAFRWVIYVILLTMALPWLSVANADRVYLNNGQTFDGEIVSQDEQTVVIDTMVSGIRAKGLTLAKADISKIVESGVPEDFYNGEPPAPPRSPNAVDVTDRSGLYLVVPMVGVFGQDVVHEGVKRVIAYAKRHDVPHVVFVVDSPGGNLDEVLMISRKMLEDNRPLTFHAIIKRCQGPALAVPLVCDTIHVTPGAVAGDSDQALNAGSQAYGEEDEQVLRAELARRAQLVAVAKGSSGQVVRAMIDPQEELAAWKQADGSLGIGKTLPGDVSQDRIIFVTKAGEKLVLNYDQLTAIGLPSLEGEAQALGDLLDMKAWQKESDYGESIMAELAEATRLAEASGNEEFKQALKANLVGRETTQAQIEHSIKQARNYDPTDNDYTAYAQSYGWGEKEVVIEPQDKGKQKKRDPQLEWQRQCDLTMGNIRKAIKACDSMERQDEAARELGLEPTYQSSDLDKWKEDLEAKYKTLGDQRNSPNFRR